MLSPEEKLRALGKDAVLAYFQKHGIELLHMLSSTGSDDVLLVRYEGVTAFPTLSDVETAIIKEEMVLRGRPLLFLF